MKGDIKEGAQKAKEFAQEKKDDKSTSLKSDIKEGYEKGKEYVQEKGEKWQGEAKKELKGDKGLKEEGGYQQKF